jgi:hypothetical protein
MEVRFNHMVSESSHCFNIYRKEIQCMLHDRRKAEIEVLFCAADFNGSTQLGAESGAQSCALSRYLVGKIIKAVNSAAVKAVH